MINFKSLLLFFIIITFNVSFAQLDTAEYRIELLGEARKFQQKFDEYRSMENKYNLLISGKDYMNMAFTYSETEPAKNVISSYSYIEAIRKFEKFISPENSFEEYKYIVVALRLYTEYYELTKEEDLGKHIAGLHKIQREEELKPYIHYGFYKNDIFDFSVATPSFDYFENLSLSCFQIEVGNNSTNEIDFSRFRFYIQTTDGKTYEEIDLEKNHEFYEALPPMPEGYTFGEVSVHETDRALKLFPLIEDESQIEKFVMEDKLSDFRIEALFFENIQKFIDK